jgi:hypothetical protein
MKISVVPSAMREGPLQGWEAVQHARHGVSPGVLNLKFATAREPARRELQIQKAHQNHIFASVDS